VRIRRAGGDNHGRKRKEPAGERSTRKVECKPFGYKTGSPTYQSITSSGMCHVDTRVAHAEKSVINHETSIHRQRIVEIVEDFLSALVRKLQAGS
jgi:hypothetical protein